MKAALDTSERTSIDYLKKQRRRRVKRFGKRLIRGLNDFIAGQSVVGDRPVYPNNEPFPYLKPLEDNWNIIRTELDEILKHREEIPSFIEVSTDQAKIAQDQRWRTFVLYGFGTKFEKNCRHAPKTARMLEQIPNLQTAFFSILGPRYEIPPHRGVSKTILRGHLGLIVPKDAKSCTMRVEDKICVWEQGKLFVFDDTYQHEVRNDTDDDRVILLFDFDRPMKVCGRLLNKVFVTLLRMTAYYQEPRAKMPSIEDRFEAATKRAQANLEKLSDPP